MRKPLVAGKTRLLRRSGGPLLPGDPEGELKALIAGCRQHEHPICNAERSIRAIECIEEGGNHVVIAKAELKALSPAIQSGGGGELQSRFSCKTK